MANENSFEGAIDFIWYTSNTVGVQGLLGEVDRTYLEKVVGFPNAHFPSDHISLMAELKFR
jgi:CCR4-NOT transcription complex subunit 6